MHRCGEDNAPDVRFDVPVNCRECARLHVLQVTTQFDSPEKPERHNVQ